MSIFDSLYTLDENQVLGEGATCKVKFATKNETDEQCAVKIFDRNAMRDDPTITESDVRREATLFKFLSDPESHPHIVKCHGYFQDSPDYLYLVFEYLSGGELFDQIASKHNYTEKEVKHLAKTILEAIQFVHQKNIIHR
jgi:serine/threonine protein kinase